MDKRSSRAKKILPAGALLWAWDADPEFGSGMGSSCTAGGMTCATASLALRERPRARRTHGKKMHRGLVMAWMRRESNGVNRFA
eukprot:773458-Prymnesium_polylepis.1